MVELPKMVCAGCGATVPAGKAPPFPFRCPNADCGDDRDHVLRPHLPDPPARFPDGGEASPFARYRTLSFAWHFARASGIADDAYLALSGELDRAIAAVDGRGFRETPFDEAAALSNALGFTGGARLWIKDETRNVAGSHKARHLQGIMLYLRALELAEKGFRLADHRLAIASCGNAALAAAVVARAAGAALCVFVPDDAGEGVRAELDRLGARLRICPRLPGERGDPCYLRFREAVRQGALPFGCQGSDNGLTIDGGRTLAFEMVSKLRTPGRTLGAIVVQVGGGALASSCTQAFAEAHRLGAFGDLPRLYAVQTEATAPLARAYERLAQRIAGGLGIEGGDRRERAERIRAAMASTSGSEAGEQELHHAATHRAEFMWPWEGEPASIARGILDDETYDWHAVVAGMLRTGGYPVLVDEPTLQRANDLARAETGIAVGPTGSAGLAGALALIAAGELHRDRDVAVLFTGGAEPDRR